MAAPESELPSGRAACNRDRVALKTEERRCSTLDVNGPIQGLASSVRRIRIGEVLLAEGLKWRQEETWFGARVEHDFTRTRG